MDVADHELLQDYARHRSEPAFTALVARHVDLVYSAAIRQVRDAHLAKDVAQQVFAELARHAARMKPDTLLAAWLHAATRRRAIDVVRTETRRRQREQTALELADAAAPDAEWSQVAPLLDKALQSLPAPERDAVLLRYFENKSLRDVGETLGISDDAAQKRVHRALERLRDHFTKRRVPLGSAGLATLLSGYAVQAAPAGLAASLSVSALASGAGVAAVAHTLAMTTLQKSLVMSALALSLGFGLYEKHQVSRLSDKLAAQESVAAQARHVAERRFAELAAENARLHAEADRLRTEAALTEAEAAADPLIQFMADWVERARTFRGRFSADSVALIPELQWIGDMHWLEVARDNRLETEDDYLRAAGELRRAAEDIFSTKAHAAVKKYLEANEDVFPFELGQLVPYFDAPVDPAVLARWTIEPAASVDGFFIDADRVITQMGRFAWALDQRTVISKHGPSKSMNPDGPYVRAAMAAFAAAHAGRTTADIQELMPYAITPRQKEALERRLAVPTHAKP